MTTTFKKFALTVSIAAGVGAAILGAPQASRAQQPGVMQGHARPNAARAHGERHPELRRALQNLLHAQSNLQHAKHDFAGHREKALDLTQQAINECRAAIGSDAH